jgi:hypothetical protein
MTQPERASLAEQLLGNPLFVALFDGVERDATEALIYAVDDDTRARAAMRVQAVRSMRDECVNSLREIRKPKAVA